MTANRRLASLRGISEETCLEIDKIHEETQKFMEEALRGFYTTTFIFNKFEEYEYKLQELWEFPTDPNYHVLYEDFKFKAEWVDRVFRCRETGEIVTITSDVVKGGWYPIGKGYLDVGDGHYFRTGGDIEEINLG